MAKEMSEKGALTFLSFFFPRMLLDVYGWLQVKVADKRLVASYTTGGEDLE